MLNRLKQFILRPSRMTVLEEEVADMKKRIFKEKVSKRDERFLLNDSLYSWWDYSYEPKPLEEDFFDSLEKLETKIDLIAKHLGIEFTTIRTKEQHLSIKKVKKSDKK